MNADVGQVVLLQLFVLVKDGLLALDLADAVLKRVDDLVRGSHLVADLVLPFAQIGDFLPDRGNLDEERLGGLDLLDLLYEFELIRAAPVRRSQAPFQLLDALLELALFVIDRVHVLADLLEILVQGLNLLFDFFDLGETLFFLFIVLAQL